VFPAMLNRTIPSSRASSSNSARSDPAQGRVSAEVFPARLNRTVPAPAASAANPTVDETASPSVSVMVPGQPVSPPEEHTGAAAPPSVAAVATARTVSSIPSAPANFANPAPTEDEAVKPAPELDPFPASSKAIAGVTRPSGTSSEFRGPVSNPAASPPTPDETNPANPTPAPAGAPSPAFGAAPNAEETNIEDSEGTIQVDPLAPDSAPLDPVVLGNVNAPGNVNVAAGNAKTGPRLSAAAPTRVSRKTGDSQAKLSPPAAASDSSDETQPPPFSTQGSAMASPDKAQPPAAASNHANQPAAASGHIDQPAAPSAAPPVPLVEGRQAPPPRGTGSNGNQAPAASENIPREAVPTPVAVQSARVLERMGQTEMRVGMNTADFGNVELRASVSQDRVGASVTTAHLDLRAALMAEMPSLEHSMEQHQLRLDHLDLGANGGGNQERGNLAQQQQPRSQSGAEAGFTTTSSSSSDALPSPEGPAPSSWGAPYSSGLNVHA